MVILKVEADMDIEKIADAFTYHGAGILFWTADREGEIWVLLARRRMRSLLGDAYKFAIPTGQLAEGEDSLSAAMRIAHDEAGICTDRNKAELFWNISTGNLSLALYSYRLSSFLKPKRGTMYSQGEWFRISSEALIEDADCLTREELKVFRHSLEESRAV